MEFDRDSMEFDRESSDSKAELMKFEECSMEFDALTSLFPRFSPLRSASCFEFDVFLVSGTQFDSWYTSARRWTQHNRSLRHKSPKWYGLDTSSNRGRGMKLSRCCGSSGEKNAPAVEKGSEIPTGNGFNKHEALEPREPEKAIGLEGEVEIVTSEMGLRSHGRTALRGEGERMMTVMRMDRPYFFLIVLSSRRTLLS